MTKHKELLRFLSIAELVPRVAIAGIPVGADVIRAGERVLLAIASAPRVR